MKLEVEVAIPTEARYFVLERHGDAFKNYLVEAAKTPKGVVKKSWREGETLYVQTLNVGKVAAKEGEDPPGVLETAEYRDSLLAQPPYTILTSSSLPGQEDRVSIAGKLSFHEEGPGKARQVNEQDITIKIRFVGGLMEKALKKGSQDTVTKMAPILQQWGAVRAELAATPEGRRHLVSGQPDLRHLPWVQEYLREMLPDIDPAAIPLTPAGMLAPAAAVVRAESMVSLASAASGKTVWYDASASLVLTDEEAAALGAEDDELEKKACEHAHVRPVEVETQAELLVALSRKYTSPPPPPQPNGGKQKEGGPGCLGSLFSCCRATPVISE